MGMRMSTSKTLRTKKLPFICKQANPNECVSLPLLLNSIRGSTGLLGVIVRILNKNVGSAGSFMIRVGTVQYGFCQPMRRKLRNIGLLSPSLIPNLTRRGRSFARVEGVFTSMDT